MTFDVRRLDIYRKIPKDLTQPTLSGAIVSVCCVAFILVMLGVELAWFISPDIRSELVVDNLNPTDRIPVRINISFPRLKCEYLGLDIQDDMGRHEVGFVENTVKTPLGFEGCLFEARFNINKVPGNFHISTHSVDQQPDKYEFDHTVHELSFGSRIKKISSKGIGSFNSLGGRSADGSGQETFEYLMKIVPTSYTDISGATLIAYQYTFAQRSFASLNFRIPAVWFKYDLNPITVKYHESRPPIYHFLTTVCAIVGGTFTVAGIINSVIFTSLEVFKKFELGKIS